MNIAEIRQKYPQYQNVDDDTLATALHKKYYADKISFDDFKAKIGLQQPQINQNINRDMGQSVRSMTPTERINQQNNDYDKFVYGIPVIGGIKKGFDDVAMGGAQLLARGVDALTLGNTNLSKTFDMAQQNKEQAYNDANKADASGYINDASRLAGSIMFGGTGNIAGGALKKIAIGAGIGTATSPVTQEIGQEGNQGEYAKQKAIQLGVGGAFGAGGAVLGKIGKTIIPPAKKEVVKLARIAKNKFGIDLRLDQVAPSRPRDTLQKLSQNTPFSGVGAQEEQAYKQWNKSLAKTLGVDADDLSPETITRFKNENSSKFKNALEDVDVVFDGQKLNQALNEINDMAKTNLSDGSDAQKVVNNYIDMFNKNFDDTKGVQIEIGAPKSKPQTDIAINGQTRKATEYDTYNINSKVLNGNKAHSLRSNLVNASVNATPEARRYIAKMINVLDDVLEKNIPKAKVKTLKEARREYRNFKTIQPLLEGSTDGFINPTGLMNRVKSSKYINASTIKEGEDDLVDLARIGKEFLPKKGGSDTAYNQVGYQVLGGGTGVATLGTSIGANTVFQKGLNQNPKAVAKSLKGGGINVLDAISKNSRTIASQSSRMTGQAMNAMRNQQDAQQQSQPQRRTIDDIKRGFYEKKQNTVTDTDARMQDILKRIRTPKPQTDNQTGYQFKRPEFVNDTTQAESSGNPNAKSKTSTASGLGGFTDGTWQQMQDKYGKEYGLNNKADPRQQQIATDLLAEDNAKYLKQKLKNRDISTKDLHVAHFMGANGATRMILNIQRGQGDKLAYQTFRKEANANKPIFFDGRRPRTINEVYAVLASRETQ